MKKFDLDPFQRNAVADVLTDLERQRRALLVAPTGAGKTVMMAHALGALKYRAITQRTSLRVLVLQHTTPLLQQNYQELEKLLGGLHRFAVAQLGAGRAGSDVRLTGRKVTLDKADIVVATVQTFKRNWGPLLPPFDIAVVDEAHHAVSPEYTAVLEQVTARNPDVGIFGLTATPERADRIGLARVWPRISHQVTIEQVIAAGRVVPATVLEARVPGLEGIAGHDWSDGEDGTISVLLRGQVTMAEMVRQHVALGQGRTAVYFCADTAHAEALAEVFREAGLRAEAVGYKTSKRALNDVMRRLRDGDIDVVTNPVMLTEGFNAPRVSLIGLARGFSSHSLLVQAVGRGMRSLKGSDKRDCLVLDFVAALERHGNLLPGTDIAGKVERPRPDEDGPKGPEWVREDGDPLDLIDHVSMHLLDAYDGVLDGIQVPLPPADDDEADEVPADGEPAQSRKEALARGLKTYIGTPCGTCGGVIRYASSPACVSCVRERSVQRLRDPAYLQRARERSRQRWQDPAYRERQRERKRELWQDPAYRERLRERNLQYRQDPTVRERERERNLQYRQDPTVRERERERNLQYRQDPTVRERERERKRDLWQDPAYRERRRERIREYAWRRMQDPAYRERRRERARERARERMQDPAYRERKRKRTREYDQQRWQDPAYRERNRERMLERKQDPEYRERNREYQREYKRKRRAATEPTPSP